MAYTVYQPYCITKEKSHFNLLLYNTCMPFPTVFLNKKGCKNKKMLFYHRWYLLNFIGCFALLYLVTLVPFCPAHCCYYCFSNICLFQQINDNDDDDDDENMP